MCKRLPWIPLHCDDIELDELDDEAEGFFSRLLRMLGRYGGRLPSDIAKLTKILHRDVRVVRRLWAKVEHLFIVAGGFIRHRTVDDAIERLEGKIRLRPNFRQKSRSNPRKTNKSAANKNTDIPSREDISVAEPSSENTPPLPSQNEREEGERTQQRPSDAKGEPTAARQRPRARHRRGATHKTPITEWRPTEADISFARERGFDDRHIGRMLDRFRNRKISEGWRLVDWSAAWRDWVLGKLDHDERYGDRRAKAEQRGHDARRAIFDFFQQRWEGAAAA
jgi:hypothetical protein